MPSAYTRVPVMDRLWARVIKHPGGCWEWQGATNDSGYGLINTGQGHLEYVHRLTLEKYLGRKLLRGMCSLHGCDNPPCVRPGGRHLFEGTKADNNRDMSAKGRGRNAGWRGAEHPRAILNDDLVKQAIIDFEDGASAQELASLLGVSKSTLWAAVTGKTWGHLHV